MNERIQQLLKESTYDILGVKQVDQNKFAELIVEECASLFPLQFTDEQYQRRIDKTIRKHFGLLND
jgi:hypothetical protein